jgi:hypothetical protein
MAAVAYCLFQQTIVRAQEHESILKKHYALIAQGDLHPRRVDLGDPRSAAKDVRQHNHPS